jgi:hypothetical protein
MWTSSGRTETPCHVRGRQGREVEEDDLNAVRDKLVVATIELQQKEPELELWKTTI